MEALVVDDQEEVARAIHRMLVDVVPEGWNVYHTADPLEGRALLVLDPRVRVAIVDILMPGLAGDLLIEQAIEKRPSLRGRIVVCSGMLFPPALERRLFVEFGCLRVNKPPDGTELRAAALQAIG